MIPRGHQARFVARLGQGEELLGRDVPQFLDRARGSLEASPTFPSDSRNTIGQGDTIEPLRLAHDNGIKDATRGASASDAIHEGSPEVRGQAERYCT